MAIVLPQQFNIPQWNQCDEFEINEMLARPCGNYRPMVQKCAIRLKEKYCQWTRTEKTAVVLFE